MVDLASFANRLRKSARHLHRWAKRADTEAYRLYDWDIPEFAYTVDWFAGRVQLTEYIRRGRTGAQGTMAVQRAVGEVLSVPPASVFLKERAPKVWGQEQYERGAAQPQPFVVREQGLKFEVELAAHLDTGLFLDHRLTRAKVRAEAAGKRFLNLFCYTGAFTVYAAAGGARQTTSVDLSNTYLDWAARNLRLNAMEQTHHRLVRADVLTWLSEAAALGERFDLVVLDPPSYSSSKAMSGTFEVQRDHPRLLWQVARLVSPAGAVYFSTNYQGFALSAQALPALRFEELTPATIPPDFRRKQVHRCWRVQVGPSGAGDEPPRRLSPRRAGRARPPRR
jgi:23S rRNA (cytosine1962-C5)-methyltransferase